ncbi:NADPH-dependent F420 reductase [Bradyrhizobium sp. Arg314]
MIVGIIGAGAVGKAVTGLLLGVGIRVVMCNSRGPDSVADVVHRLGPGATAGTLEQVVQPEIIFLAVPWSQVPIVLTDIPDFEGRILIDATNPLEPSAGRRGELEARTSSEVVTDLASGARVVKAFNTLRADVLALGPRHGLGRRVIFFSGDHAPSKAEVGRLIGRMGFAGVDLGKLAEGGRLQQVPGGPLSNLDLIRLE